MRIYPIYFKLQDTLQSDGLHTFYGFGASVVLRFLQADNEWALFRRSLTGTQTHISYVSCSGRWVSLPLTPPGEPGRFHTEVTRRELSTEPLEGVQPWLTAWLGVIQADF